MSRQHRQTLLNPHLQAAKADQRPALQALPGQKRPTAHARPIPSPVAEHRAPQAPAHRRDRSQPEIVVALVRAGSARHRKPLVLAGRQRSRPAHNNRRSHGLHRSRLGLPSSTGPGSSPSPQRLPRASGPCQRGRRHRGRARPCRRGGAIAARPEPCSASPAVPRTCPKHRSTAVIHGQPRSVRVPPSCSISPSGAVLGSFPSSRCSGRG
jgi:hypothetical protein